MRDNSRNDWSYLAKVLLLAFILSCSFCGGAQTNVAHPDLIEQARNRCIEGRRYVCGKVVQIVPTGLVVDSGYTSLMQPPYHTSWVMPGTISPARAADAVEVTAPDSACIGLVFVTDIPRRPKAKLYDFVVLHVYPAGQYVYTPLSPVHKTIRKFSAGLDTAVKLVLQNGEK
jgi:hypothetical protein